MKKPDNDETATALRFAHIPVSQRTPEQVDFLDQFQKHYLEPDEGMDASAHAAELSPATYEIYHLLRKDGLLQYKWPEKIPVHEPLPEIERYAIEQMSEILEPVGSNNSSRRASHEVRTSTGDLLGTVLAHRRVPDEEIGRFLKHRQGDAKWSARAKWVSRLAIAAVLVTGGYIAGKSAFRAKRAAEQVGGEVEQVQQDVGKFGERIATDSSGVPIPRTKDHQKN